ncbi:hypothetical protein BTT_65490 (plasmid) [Bacillus thuringiensis serovar morrisoni str. 4AA1]|uniref:hypothetical protein n=1 Tax=Bacillus TaxID=1386 RepID=UPI000A3855EB|nr:MULTISPECIES: hypothetical protein [Bacillus]MED3102285.1 hypothetical protein [Bacillus thuringiensis]MRA99920.1 hypothetical protein [Bacillus thuringiensis]OTY45399.1 hypothetical protein BK736_02575 [Bacillus thuringiensis serovar poloniensis]RNG45575.1 hypothetical protein EEL55_16065 [Bacillus thuringiensis]RUR59042.1 hypothetical protein ELS81_30475 [Bacillus sp. VKPM B-3276]
MDGFSFIRVIEYSIEIFKSLPLPLTIVLILGNVLFISRMIIDYFLEKDASKRYWKRYYAEQKESEGKISLKK